MKKIKTKIWYEKPLEENPFAPEESFLHGKNYYRNLALKFSFTEMIYFHIKGKKPAKSSREWLDVLLNLSANPGIRDESVRTAMNVAIGRGPYVNSVLAGLIARSGKNRGSRWIAMVMLYLQKAVKGEHDFDACDPYSGLGLHFGSPDKRIRGVLSFLKKKKYFGGHSKFLVGRATKQDPLLLEGLIAAGFLDLGFSPQEGSLLFLMTSAPAIFAYSKEQYDLFFKEYPNFFEKGAYIYEGPEAREMI